MIIPKLPNYKNLYPKYSKESLNGDTFNNRSTLFYQSRQSNNFSYITIKVATCSAINIVKVTIFIERQLIYLLAIETVTFPAELFSDRKQVLLLDRRHVS
jgi:hypothetical protein